MRESEDIGSAWLPLARITMRLGIEAANVLRTHHHAVGNAQTIERVRDLHVVDHAAAHERNLAANARRDVDDLLDAVNREAKHDKITRAGAERQSSSMRGTMARSDGVNPGRSTLVESLKSASTPSAP